MHSGDVGEIYFAATVPEMVADCISDYLDEHPNVQIHQYGGTSDQIKDMLQHQMIDFAISVVPITGENIQWTPIFTETFGVILSKDHPLASRQALNIEELQNERFILNSNVDQKAAITEFCINAGFTPNVFFEGVTPELIGRLVSQNYGISLVSEERYKAQFGWSSYAHYNQKITYCRTKPECRRTTGIAMLRNHYFLPSSQQFLQHLIQDLQSRHNSKQETNL